MYCLRYKGVIARQCRKYHMSEQFLESTVCKPYSLTDFHLLKLVILIRQLRVQLDISQCQIIKEYQPKAGRKPMPCIDSWPLLPVHAPPSSFSIAHSVEIVHDLYTISGSHACHGFPHLRIPICSNTFDFRREGSECGGGRVRGGRIT